MSPDDPKALYRRAKSFMSQGHNEKALKDVSRLLEVEPKNKDAILMMKTLKEMMISGHEEGTNI